MYGFKICEEISKGTFKISHTHNFEPHTANYTFYWLLFLYDYNIFELWRHKLP